MPRKLRVQYPGAIYHLDEPRRPPAAGAGLAAVQMMNWGREFYENNEGVRKNHEDIDQMRFFMVAGPNSLEKIGSYITAPPPQFNAPWSQGSNRIQFPKFFEPEGFFSILSQ